MHLESAKRHASIACRFNDVRFATREIKDAVTDLTSAIELLTDTLNDRRDLF